METKEITEKWLNEEVAPKYEAIFKKINGGDTEPELYASVIGAVVEKAITPLAYWAAERGLIELKTFFPSRSAPSASSGAYTATPVPNSQPEQKPARTDFGGFKTGEGEPVKNFGDWGFCGNAAITGDEVVITWNDKTTSKASLGNFQEKTSQNGNLYRQGFVDGKEIRIVKTKKGLGVSVKGGAK